MRQQLQEKYERATKEFNSEKIQQKYEELKNRLEEIERNFSDPETQKEYTTTEKKYNERRMSAVPNLFRAHKLFMPALLS